MSLTTKGKLQYSQEQYNFARYETSALEYVRQQGYPLKKLGNYYIHKEHDSLVFGQNGMWYWNARDMKGGAIEFLTHVEGKTLVEAVLTLNGDKQLSQETRPEVAPKQDYSKKEIEQLPFVLPTKAEGAKTNRLFGFLCKERKLDAGIVQDLVHQKKIYLGVELMPSGKEIYNAVFLGLDKNGEAKSAFKRGTWTAPGGTAFKRDVAGSDKQHYPFHMEGTSNTVKIFESSIDAISEATLAKMDAGSYNHVHRIALGGLTAQPIISFLEGNPQVKNVVFCLDNDEAGKNGTSTLISTLCEKGYHTDNGYSYSKQKPHNKDFNEDLVQRKMVLEAQSKTADVDHDKEQEQTEELER